jgi:hypothetical protein
VLHPGAAAELELGTMAEPRLGSLAGALAAAAVGGAPAAAQTALRAAANCFRLPAARAWALSQREALLDGFAGCGRPEAGGSKGTRLGLATLLLNYAVAGREPGAPPDPEGKMQVRGARRSAAAPAPARRSHLSCMLPLLLFSPDRHPLTPPPPPPPPPPHPPPPPASRPPYSPKVLSCLEDLLGGLPADEADAAARGLTALAALVDGDAGLAGVAKDLGLGGAAARLGGGKAAAAAAEVKRVLG